MQSSGRKLALSDPISSPSVDDADTVIDLKQFHNIAALRPGSKLASRIVDCFRSDATELVKSLKECDTHVRAKELAHTLVGCARGVGARKLSATARRLEQMNESTGSAEYTELVRTLPGLVDEAVAALDQLVAIGDAQRAAQ
jgi:HPt (histidine-containing phosphotransfer) domain-containing protein